jgi:hypothetical protein
MDVLSALPYDIGHVRQMLFTLPLPFSLSIANQELFWPLINNAYSIRHSENVGPRKRNSRATHVRHCVICRFKRARALPSASQGKHASSIKRNIAGCDVTFHLLAFSDHYKYWPAKKPSDVDFITCLGHSHSLDESDANKRNSFLRKLVGAEVANGYPPAAVIRSLIGDGRADARALLASAGGAYLTRQDVINAGLT